MPNKAMQANLMMLLAASIWGFAFVAQRVGMETMGPHWFNSLRFFIGVVALTPVVIWMDRVQAKSATESPKSSVKTLLMGGAVAGFLLFIGATFQQVGLQYTTAGKAGFITGMYIFFVPLIGLFFRMKTGLGTWLGALIALWGLYLLSINEDFTLSKGDTLQLICAVAFAGHVLMIGYLASRMDTVKLSLVQFFVAGLLAMILALYSEQLTWGMVTSTAVPLLFAGVMSTGIAYTLQTIAQQHAHPSHAAIILSSEGVFAVIGGFLLLNEVLPVQGLLGCGLILAGMLMSQLMPRLSWPRRVKVV
ncbi:DMT family transporter [Oceanospirillaceae bacterium]|jgi:drug/metabolite transporter (DMT)-like permease|nr:DMT family transporter [Oceanospirillaceae bacterium]MBT4998257.1 DMT family transporter [Oceanospirillaceae bacterium]MBT5630531.1 DMT family transporter [Oceanospirillaceae bacterium]MBT6102212.1 DMT family transporter [Oceanospirillaceae bacterium]MBT7672835.1 DMT family transporter [Oceanospirillaceae bacterium]|tara:strand:+ start:1574 stop:2488 length:915 start_codon:yes stop_codon:yes gene_type:complete